MLATRHERGLIKRYRRLAATLADGACCQLINVVQRSLPDHTNSPVELANYLAGCRTMNRQQYYAKEPINGLAITNSWVNWCSPVHSGFAVNDIARAQIFISGGGWPAPTVFFLHALMSASDLGYRRIAGRFNRHGWNAVFVHLPFHYSRVPAGYFNGALALSSELIRNAETIRQAVMEIRQLLELFRNRGADRFGLIGTSYGGWIGSILLTLEDNFQFAALLQPIVDVEDAIWRSPAALAIRSRLRRHLIEPGISRQHAHLSCPFHQRPLLNPDRIQVAAGEFDQIVPLETLDRFTASWDVRNLEIVPQGHFGYVAMNRVLRRVLA